MAFSFLKTPLLMGSLAFLLISCSGTEKEIEDTPVEELYTHAKDFLDKGSYTQAAKLFSEVERQHPYSIWSVRAQLMAAYALYEGKKYEEAIEGFHAFTQLHPGDKNIPYAYYMMGLCYYEQIPTIHRSQEPTEKAQKTFQEVLFRFPKSPYGRDAKFKLDLIFDHLAGKEMDVGRYYLSERAFIAALNRFKKVVEEYQTSSQTPEALHRMVECYIALGILDQARITAAILGHNYRGSVWYADTYTLIKQHAPDLITPRKEGNKPSLSPPPFPKKAPDFSGI